MELFTTIGKVERAEIQYEPNGRSRGTGVVQFDTVENAETAICTLLPGSEMAEVQSLHLWQLNSLDTNMVVVHLV